MDRSRSPLLLAAALVPVALLSGCGGAPTDASKEDFCQAATDQDWILELGADPDGQEIVDGFAAWAEDLEEVGTPEDIDDDARKGFEVSVEYLSDLDPDDFEDLSDAATVTDDLSEEEQDQVQAYNEYVDETCAGGLGGDDPEQ